MQAIAASCSIGALMSLTAAGAIMLYGGGMVPPPGTGRFLFVALPSLLTGFTVAFLSMRLFWRRYFTVRDLWHNLGELWNAFGKEL
jgi:hypothetical protein